MAETLVNHTLFYSADVKNEWSYTSTPPICLHGVKRENFTLTRNIFGMLIS